jgi:hypothetical protein
MLNLLCVLLGAAFLQPGVCGNISQSPAFAGATPAPITACNHDCRVPGIPKGKARKAETAE